MKEPIPIIWRALPFKCVLILKLIMNFALDFLRYVPLSGISRILKIEIPSLQSSLPACQHFNTHHHRRCHHSHHHHPHHHPHHHHHHHHNHHHNCHLHHAAALSSQRGA